ncbi:efflux RND transporter periplasmic adaptor subunit [Chitinimonas lacunae]|uniref:Efflux RND transporter periplasmic adaptor subunit n=1 Tax=Chitinimonas lacunae TaxID=1963018 RepID=A0ABV8MMU8_9NEIS
MKPPFRLAVLAGLIVLASAALLARDPQPAAPAPAARAALTVQLVEPQTQDWPLTLDAGGTISPWQEASIGAETGGLRIVALHADVGSRVKRGQLLAELAADTIRAEQRQAEAGVAQARAALAEALANAERGAAVRDSGALSTQQIEQYQLAAQSAAARLEAAEAALAAVRIKLNQTRIVAIDDGLITARAAVLGTVVTAGSELFRLQRQERLEWRAEIGARQLGRLVAGQSASLSLPDGSRVNGTVRALSPTLDNASRNALVHIDLPGGNAARAGMYARGTIELGRTATQTVPASAITLRDGHSYVFEVDGSGRVKQRKVTTGRSRNEQIEILDRLAANTRLVERGGAFLHEGDLVRIAQSKQEAK